MKEIQHLPLETKPDPSTHDRAEGRYLLKHPLIKKYFLEITVEISEIQEIISIKLVCLVSVNKSIFRSVPRFCTWDECQMVKEVFWYPSEEVMQLQRVNDEEMQAGNYYSHLFKKNEKILMYGDERVIV